MFAVSLPARTARRCALSICRLTLWWRPGDRIVTSGHGGALPSGIPVGIIAVVGEADIEVEPFVDPARLEVVQVLDYGLDGIIEFKTRRGDKAK